MGNHVEEEVFLDHPGQIVAKKRRSKFGSNDKSKCKLPVSLFCICEELKGSILKTCECLFVVDRCH